MSGHLGGFRDGSVAERLNMTTIRALPVPLLSLEDQEVIAATLGALDDKIEVNRQMAATLEEMARALYRSWFVDFDPVKARAEGRAPAHMDPATAALFPARFTDDGLPEGWAMGTLGDIARNRREQVQPAAIDPETPYVGLEHMPRRSIAIGDWGTAGDVGSAKSRVTEGSFLFGKLRPYFHKVGLAPVDGICSTDILVIEAGDPVWSALVLSVISSEPFVEHANATSSGTRMPRANWGDMARFAVCVPDRRVAGAFRDIVAPMHARIVQTMYENRSLAALRDTLLPKLMSGELCVREAEAQVEEVA
jgi:type I restriction enzyme S subunit